MTFQEAIEKSLLEQALYVRRKSWAQGIAMVVMKDQLELQHIVTCKLKGPKPYEYLKNDWEVGYIGNF